MPVSLNQYAPDLIDIANAFEKLIPLYKKYTFFDRHDMVYNYMFTIGSHFHNGKMDNVLNIPKEDLPLHINDKDNYDRMLVEWRLSCNF